MAKKSTHDLLRETQAARADMQTFAAVVAALELGVGSAHHSAKSKIISISNAEMQKALKRMDAAGNEIEKRATQAAKGVSDA